MAKAATWAFALTACLAFPPLFMLMAIYHMVDGGSELSNEFKRK